MLKSLALFAVLTISTMSFAAESQTAPGFWETCSLSGEIVLAEYTQIVCTETETLVIAPGTKITAGNGHELQIWSAGNIEFADLSIVAVGQNAPITITAQSVSGKLHIDNQGDDASNSNGLVSLDYVTSSASFEKDLTTDQFSSIITPDFNVGDVEE